MQASVEFIHIANVYCFGNQRKQFCYKIPDETDNSSKTDKYKGSLVKVEFGKKILIGIVISIEEKEVKNNTIELGNKPFEDCYVAERFCRLNPELILYIKTKTFSIKNSCKYILL